MEIVRLAKRSDLAALLAFQEESLFSFRLPPYAALAEEELSQAIEDGRVKVFIRERRILAMTVYTHDVIGSLFPKTHSRRNCDDLLEKLGCQSMETLVFTHVFLSLRDEKFEGAKRLFLSFFAEKKGADFLALSPQEDSEKHRFFLTLGFQASLEQIESEYPVSLHVKAYVAPGLCRNIGW